MSMTFNELVEIARLSGREKYIKLMKDYKTSVDNRGEKTIDEIKQELVDKYLRNGL